MNNTDLDMLRTELDEFSTPKKSATQLSATQERIIAGFEDIERFFEQHGRAPLHGENNDIFERLYAVRLEKICSSDECLAILAGRDKYGLLQNSNIIKYNPVSALSDDEILEELETFTPAHNDITQLKYVKPRTKINAPESIAQRSPCADFDTFKPLFETVQKELDVGLRKTNEFKNNAGIEAGNFFILGGQKVYIAEVGEEIKAPNGETDARLRVIYDNGTESNLLRRSLQRALYKDEVGRRITDPSIGPLFSGEFEDGDIGSGTIYILRSKSDHPVINAHQDIIHKIGVTSGDVNKRIANAKLDPTFLMAEAEVVATYELSNINRTKLENLIHKFFEPARLDIEIKDRFGNPVKPHEWFLVPLFVIDEAIRKIKEGTIVDFFYDIEEGCIRMIS
jgi:hypothetical protein